MNTLKVPSVWLALPGTSATASTNRDVNPINTLKAIGAGLALPGTSATAKSKHPVHRDTPTGTSVWIVPPGALAQTALRLAVKQWETRATA